MKRKITLVLVFLFAIGISEMLIAQCPFPHAPCPSGLAPIGQSDPQQTCLIENLCSLNGLQDELPPTGTVTFIPPVWCTTVENNLFYAFTAPPSGWVVFHLTDIVCTGVDGALQAAVLDCNFNPASICYGEIIPPGFTFTLTAPLIAGETYYLMLDGYAGATCQYNIIMDPISCSENPAPAPPTVGGPTQVCVGDVGTYLGLSEFIPADLGGNYNLEYTNIYWSVSGSEAEFLSNSNGATIVEVFWGAPGFYELTATVVNEEYGNIGSSTILVEVVEGAESTVEMEVCEGECVLFDGQLYCDEGIYEIPYNIGTGCDSIVNLILTEIPSVEIFLEDTIPCNGMYLFAGDTLTDLLTPFAFHFTGQNGCDSIVNLTLVPNADIYGFAGPSQSISCIAPDTIELNGNVEYPADGFLIEWTTEDGVILSGGNSFGPQVGAVGTYCMIVIDTVSNCQLTDCTQVVENDSKPIIVFEEAFVECISDPNGLVGLLANVTAHPDAVYEWSTVDGNFDQVGNTSILLNEEGTYCLTVTNPSGCDTTACVELYNDLEVELLSPISECPGSDIFLQFQVEGTNHPSVNVFWQKENGPVNQLSTLVTPTILVDVLFFEETTNITYWAISEFGCATDTLMATILAESPDVQFAVEQNICNEATIEVTEPADAYSFTWSNGLSGQDQNPITITQDGTYSVTVLSGNGCISTGDVFVELDFTGSCVYINGSVNEDLGGNCQPDANEPPLEGWTVRASGTAGDFFSTTAADGSYSIPVEPGDYAVTVLPPSGLWQVCQNGVAVSLPNAGDSQTVNFLVQSFADCPLMRVDISSGVLRVCMDNLYTVRYCNDGTVAATDAYIDITLDNLLTLQNSTNGYTNLGNNVYRFQIGDVAPNECGQFFIRTFVDCNAPMGFTHCTQAHIFPDETCTTPDPLWSGALLKIEGECDGATRFTITNNGSGTMAEPLGYTIYRNSDIHLYNEEVPLAPGETHLIELPADTAFWRVEVNQEPYSPSDALVMSSVEGCTGSGFEQVVNTFVSDLAAADQDDFIDEDCRPNTGSFDPNDKTGIPFGYGEEHFIGQNTDLEYRIRFQNTGTDTAFSVVLRDTLANLLDISTLRMGASSHAYIYELIGNGILRIEFPGIKLPHESVNELGSMGYVEFKISPFDSLLPFTEIENSASIYFDFNKPIITNTTLHTIEKPVVHSYQQIDLCKGGFYNGTPYFNDITIAETISFPFYDSISWTEISIQPLIDTTIYVTICGGPNGTYCLNGVIYDEGGTYQQTVPSAVACDTNYTIIITEFPPVNTNLFESVCPGGTYSYNGQELESPGNYEFVLVASNGCDSIVNLILADSDTIATSTNIEICQGSTYEFNGMQLDSAGQYEAVFESISGCDSLVELTLAVSLLYETSTTAQICSGDTFDFYGEMLDSSGQYEKLLSSFDGCDSLIILDLQVLPTFDVPISAEICEGDAYQFNGLLLTDEGEYTADLLSINGCDSTVTLTLTVWDAYDIENTLTICAGDSVEFGGQQYFESGTYKQELISINGCDSLETLELTVLDSIVSSESQVICENDTLDFNGQLLTETGIYQTTYTSLEGCDSTVTLTLEVRPVFLDTLEEFVEIGDLYNGVPIFSDTVFTEVFLDEYNCEGLRTIFVFAVLSTGENLADEIALSIFPNPADERFYVKFELPGATDATVEIFDFVGQKVVSTSQNNFFSPGENIVEIDSRNWAAGIYLVQIRMHNGIATRKVLID
ncbi:MAG: T9SS type A sorting domain-containing protein [Bacteroidota bacterium]